MFKEFVEIAGNVLVDIDLPNDFIWVFNFDNDLSITLECTWRLLKSNTIVLSDGDHMQKFGRDNPVNVASEAKLLLSGIPIETFAIGELPADLRIKFGNNIVLEAFCDSSGYESWQMILQGKTYVVTGGGKGLWV